MFLVKFTDPEWKKAAVSGRSIRVGSVLHYREIDDPTFRDEDEGEGFTVYKSNIHLDSEKHDRIFPDAGFKLNAGWTIDTGGCPLISEKSIFNPFIFSCSIVPKKDMIPRIAQKFGKTSWYYFNDVWKFVDAVSLGLKKHILEQAKNNPEFTMSEGARKKLGKLELLPVIGKVSYTDEIKKRIVDEDNIDSFNGRTFEVAPYFRKPTSFKDECEFRMIWLPNLGCLERDEYDFMTTNIRTVDLTLSSHGLAARKKSIKEIHSKNGKKIA